MSEKTLPSDDQVKAIKRAIKILGSQTALAKALKVSPSAVSHWNKGLNAVTSKNARKIELVTNKAVLASELAHCLIKEKEFIKDGGLGAYK